MSILFSIKFQIFNFNYSFFFQFENIYLDFDRIITKGLNDFVEKDINRLGFTIFISVFVLQQHFYIVHGPELVLRKVSLSILLSFFIPSSLGLILFKSNLRSFKLFYRKVSFFICSILFIRTKLVL